MKKAVETICRHTAYPAFDVLVVDDASTDGSCSDLPRLDGVCAVRSEKRSGVAGARSLGASAARGPVLVFADGHILPADDCWLIRLVEELERRDWWAILAPAIFPLQPEDWAADITKQAFGSSVDMALRTVWSRRLVVWDEPVLEVAATRGMCRVMTRVVYEAIGGFDDTLTYGAEEADVGIRGWMCGVPSAYCARSAIGHLYKTRSQFPRTRADEARNRLRVAFKCFNNATFQEVVRANKLDLATSTKSGLSVFEAALRLFQSDARELEVAREATIRRSLFPGEWVLRKFRIRPRV